VIVLLLGLLLHRRLARPLRNLTVAIDLARRGETSIAPVEGPREMAAVAEAFNGMIAEHQAFEDHLATQAVHDPLTGLPNRAFVLDLLHRAVDRAGEGGPPVAVAFLDLDRFKLVNDSHGHAAGDHVLIALGERLHGSLDPAETVARFGGDEFVVVCNPLVGNAESVAQRLASALGEPFWYDGQEIFLSGSVGLSISGMGQSGEGRIAEADAAMYRAKDLGRACYVVFDELMRDHARARLATETGLHRAIEREEFVLHYQPQISLDDGLVVGAEALLRWNHPERGLLGPTSFMDVAEETGLIVPIGEWVLRTACEQGRDWKRMGFQPVISVNLSARQLWGGGLVRLVGDVIASTGMGEHLELELTESMVMHDAENVIATMQALKALGVRLSVDDFGTGYSSLSYLKRLPLTALKIDGSFVRDITSGGPDEGLIAKAIISLGHSLHLKVIAEGVETEEHRKFLADHQCDEIQGYLISKPVAAIEVQKYFKKRTVASPAPAS
jgi:diguanylate cyclase (GGDEF)-like protein